MPMPPLLMDDEARGNGGVLITFRDMYLQLQQLVIELREINQAMKVQGSTATDHEIRLRALERWRYSLPVSLVVSLGSAIIAIIAAAGGGR